MIKVREENIINVPKNHLSVKASYLLTINRDYNKMALFIKLMNQLIYQQR